MSTQKHLSILPGLLKKKGVEHVVISPGSRNAPLIQVFHAVFKKACISIVDERSAGYFALGLALKSQKPTVIITTSGTAVLNLAPAMAEAFHQGVPLLALTADRPPEWIDQQDNQTIRQKGALDKNCKTSLELPISCETEEELWYASRLINEAYNISMSGKLGPVHLNIPLREPLYNKIELAKNISVNRQTKLAEQTIDSKLIDSWIKAERIMLVCGQSVPDKNLQETLNNLSFDQRVVVFSESISNSKGENIIQNPDYIFHAFKIEVSDLEPDLVIYFGGQIISKRLKQYLRDLKNKEFWFVSAGEDHVDTFKNLTVKVQSSEVSFFKSLYNTVLQNRASDYSNNWNKLQQTLQSRINSVDLAFSDLKVCQILSGKIKNSDILFAGNSSVIRYLQMFSNNADSVYANRGTSGIDGCISTASGIATISSKKVVAIVGDLSFVYDSNGLWNRQLPKNLKIVVVNNMGGGIFSLIDGPKQQDSFLEYFEAYHPVEIQKITEAFHLDYFKCNSLETINEAYSSFYHSANAAVLEISTSSEINNATFRNFVKNIKNNEQ